DFVLDALDPHAMTDVQLGRGVNQLTAVRIRQTPDLETERSVELQRLAARRRFRVAEHDANLLTHLIDEDENRARLRSRTDEFPHRLRHQSRLETHVAVAHISVKFGLRDESRHRVNDNNVKSTREREGFNNLQSLFTVVRLRDDEVFN